MRFFKKKKQSPIELDEILLDASNLPAFNTGRLEGRLALPLSRRSIIGVGVAFTLIALVYFGQVFRLQVVRGEAYRAQSERNRLDVSLVIASRGLISDRTGERLAWNAEDGESADFTSRAYTARGGLGQLLGYVQYPRKDSSGVYFRTAYEGVSGVEAAYDGVLAGENGEQLIEIDATGAVISSHIARESHSGESLSLTIDAAFSEALYDALSATAEEYGFRSGAAAVMDVESGEVIALVNVPSYDPAVLAAGQDRAAIDALRSDARLPFLNRFLSGVYTPGSVIKPFIAYAALAEGVIDAKKEIVSEGELVVQNPYDPERPTIFRDWRAHGATDMRRAIAVSSNVYFYTIGGGYGTQQGLGISRIEKYMRHFGFGEPLRTALADGPSGVVPNSTWKRGQFNEDWRLGDTYHTAIGQFGFQVTPLQLLSAYGALANGGILRTPHFARGETSASRDLGLSETHLTVIREGVRQSVQEGTARSLARSDVRIAAKTGTAEVGEGNQFINSWVAGYFPYEHPQYAFVALLEHGPRSNLFGAAPTMSRVFQWLAEERPEYLGIELAE